MSRPLHLLFTLPLLAASCSPDTNAGDRIRFTAIPDDNKSELMARFEPLAAHLTEALGAPVEYVPTSDYQAAVEAFKNGDVQLAWFGGLTGAQARSAVQGARAIAQGSLDIRFRSYFIAHVDTELTLSDNFPAELRGRTFTFGSESSTSGRLMPEHFIRTHTGESPEQFFGKACHFSGSHDKTAKLVEAGTFEAGAINYKTYDRMVESGDLDPERCLVIWVTPPYADYNWTAHPTLDETHGAGTIDRIRTSLTDLRDPAILSAMDRPGGIISARNEDFEDIHDVAKELGFIH